MSRARGLASAGRLLDPYVEAISASASSSWRSPWAALNVWRRRRREAGVDSAALAALSSADRSFSREPFLLSARAGYAEVFGAITAGRLAEAKPLLTERAFIAVQRGVAASAAAAGGARQGSLVLATPEAPTIVHARAGFTASEMSRSLLAGPDFFQLTVRHVTLQMPCAGGGGGEGGSGAASSPRARSLVRAAAPAQQQLPSPDLEAEMAAGEWVPVEDPASGHVYYANASTGAASWAPPPPAQWLTGRIPFRIEMAGCARTPVADEEAAAARGGDKPAVRVVHHVVWERMVVRGAPPGLWRIAKL